MSLEAFDLTNWRDHPTQKKYMVFFFDKADRADHFESLLKAESIWYERHTDEREWFAVLKSNQDRVKRLNHLTIGKYRQRFIPNSVFRYFVLILSFIVLALAIIGFFRNAG